jgi:hypothetical protein
VRRSAWWKRNYESGWEWSRALRSATRGALLTAFVSDFLVHARMSASSILSTSIPASNRAYHTSTARMVLNRAMDSRYDWTQVSTASRAHSSPKPLLRHATTKLASKRLTSHSQEAGAFRPGRECRK